MYDGIEYNKTEPGPCRTKFNPEQLVIINNAAKALQLIKQNQ
jgi:hypothetical protein